MNSTIRRAIDLYKKVSNTLPSFLRSKVISNITQQFRNDFESKKASYFTSLEEAVEIAKKRRHDLELKQKVDAFLKNSIPDHFNKDLPVLYLSRHIATPNFEALHFIEMSKKFELPIIIGQDAGGKFTSLNPLKRCLGKMSVVSGMTRYQDEIVENFTIINFNESEGKKLKEIKTLNGDSLVALHNKLLLEAYPDLVMIADEENWVNENYRENLVKQYERMLALNTYYGIIFESFPMEETVFFNEIFSPAYNNVTKTLGVKPLVVELLTNEEDASKNWNSYPSVFYPYLKQLI